MYQIWSPLAMDPKVHHDAPLSCKHRSFRPSRGSHLLSIHGPYGPFPTLDVQDLLVEPCFLILATPTQPLSLNPKVQAGLRSLQPRTVALSYILLHECWDEFNSGLLRSVC